MNPFGRNAALFLAGVLLVYVPISAGRQVGRCSQPEERCLPIRNCPLYYSRSKANEQNSNRDFGTPVSELKCQPEHRIDDTQHICCPKEKIRCSLGTHPGICTRPERCPAFSKKNKPELVTKNVTNLCYIHNNQSYVCCPDLHLAMHEHQMEAGSEMKPNKRTIRASENKQSISAFPRCSQDGRAFLVPKPLCDCEYTFVRGSSKACCKLPDTDLYISHPNAEKLAEVSCGRQVLPFILPRILLGNETEPSEFPWMALLVYKEGVKAFCGGTLIHPRYVLTAAHCIKKYPGKLLTVHLGEHNLVPHTRSPEIQEISIEKEITHPVRDIGLLKLRHAAELVTGKVEPICLPLTKRLLMHLPSTLIISGWGKTEHFRPKYAVRNLYDQPHPLLQAKVNVLLNSAECIHDYEVCAGGPGYSNTCYGDSGGPYQAESLYNGSERFVQYAVISSGPAYCESVDRPSRGILVSYFMQWILDTMEIE